MTSDSLNTLRWTFAILLSGCGFTLQPAPATTDADTSRDGRVPDAIELDAPGGSIDAAIDAAPIPDAFVPPAFDPATCPAGYTATIVASPLSRYRFIMSNQSWVTQHQDCANDLVGATHLVVLDTVAEAQQVNAATSSTSYHVGAAQPPGQANPLAGWLALTGEPVSATVWYPGQPNDNDYAENSQQDRGAVNTGVSSLLQDVEATFSTHAVCECDGKGVAPAVSAFL